MTNIKTIKYKNKEEIDLKRYNSLISKSNNKSIYCFSWYLDAVSDNWGCLIKGDYEAIMPIPYTIKLNQKIIYQPFFSRELNVYSNKTINNIEEIKEFILAIPKEFKKIDFNIEKNVKLEDFDIKKCKNQELKLYNKYENNRIKFSKNTKRQINKATKHNLKIEKSKNEDSFVSFFKKNTGKQVNFNEYNYSKLKQLIKTIIKNNKGHIYIVKENENILAQGVFINSHKTIIYLKGTVNKRGKQIGAMFYLMNNIIKHGTENGYNLLDFGGSNIENIANFYKKFGAEDRQYFKYSKNKLPFILKVGKIIIDNITLNK